MAGLREGKSSTEDVRLTPTCGVREEAHFTCGAHEDALMWPFELPPREEGEGVDLPRHIPELQPWEEADTEGAPRLMPGSAGQQAALQVVVEARRSMLNSGGVLPLHKETVLQDMLKGAMAGRHASCILGETGVGKTKRMPLAALLALAGEDPKGVLHVLPRKRASEPCPTFYQESEILVVSPAICADSWISKSNGVSICSAQIALHDLGFLYNGLWMKLGASNAKAELAEWLKVWCFTWQTPLDQVARGAQ